MIQMKNMKISKILAIALFSLASCGREPLADEPLPCTQEITLHIVSGDVQSKAIDPDENKIRNINLFIYDAGGLLESHIYKEVSTEEKDVQLRVFTATGRRCNIYAFANAGYRLPDYSHDEIKEFKWHIAYPDDYAGGMAMAGMLEDVVLKSGEDVTISLERLMAKVSIRFDRSRLNEDVEMSVTSVLVGNCPNCARVYGESSPSGRRELFNIGFFRDGRQAQILNSRDSKGRSAEVSLYLMENICKDGAADKALTSYIEIGMDYLSDYYFTDSGKSLKYRFYISYKGQTGVQRNCHYHITIRPAADGLLCEDSWRVDRSGLSEYTGRPYLRIMPSGTTIDGLFYSNYYTLERGASRHFRISKYPPSMKVRLREDLVQDERDEGRMSYEMDADNLGFTATSLGKPCLSMMEIIPEEPLSSDDDFEIIAIQVD